MDSSNFYVVYIFYLQNIKLLAVVKWKFNRKSNKGHWVSSNINQLKCIFCLEFRIQAENVFEWFESLKVLYKQDPLKI